MEEPCQLIVLLDGTNNTLTGGKEDTNVLQVLDRLTPAAGRQRVFYDPGVGNSGALPGATWTDKFKRQWLRLKGLAFGNGVYDNIGEAYVFLATHYQDGDEIFIFGFSRGAFEARALAGLVNMFGLLRVDQLHMVPSLISIYFAERNTKAEETRKKIIAQMRRLLVGSQRQDVWVHFLGLWDTVASIGIPPFDRQITGSPSMKEPGTGKAKHYRHVRQALALDEQRLSFMPRPYLEDNFADKLDEDPVNGQTLKQLWFHGDHCDVGGGHPRDNQLAAQAAEWIVSEARANGLRLAARVGTEPGSSGLTPAGGKLCIHSQTYDTPAWAVIGLRVRNPSVALDENDKPSPIRPEAFVGTAQWKPVYPQDTVWNERRALRPVVLALGIGALLYLCMGLALLGWSVQGNSAAEQLSAIATANTDFARWQLAAWQGAAWPLRQPPGSAPGIALLLDLGFIGCYGYLLARLATRAFASLVGVRTISSPRSRWLNLLGMGLAVTVFADVAENVLTFLVLPQGWLDTLVASQALPPWLATGLHWLARFLMFAAVLVKAAGGLMLLNLLVWAALGSLKPRQGDPEREQPAPS